MHHVSTPRPMRAAAATLLVLAAACASAGKKYDQARQMEAQGRAADAAERYVDALKREPGLADARQRLQETGDRAVRDYVAEATQLARAGQADAAADRFFEADALRRAATGVGVELRVPDDYVPRRTAAFDGAIAAALAAAQGAGARGQWDSGVSGLERAAQRYQPTSEQARALGQARYDAFLGHARDEMARGRFRSSFAVATRALEVFGRYGPDADAALAVQREALQRGSVRVAIFPIGVREALRDTLPLDLVPSLWQAMTTQKWSHPPDFVQFVGSERWTAPRWGRAARELSPYDAAGLGAQLGADLVVVLTVDSASRQDALTTDRRAAKTRTGADTAYTVNQGRRTLWTRVRYDVVQVGSRRSLASGTAEGRTGAPIHYADFAGDANALNVSAAEHDLLFRNWRRPVDEEIVREMVDQLDDRLSDAIYERLLAQVP
jgi:tetratricopeptide (TPR) repeat protein